MSNLITDDNKEKILFVSHKNNQCGVYQYGINIINTIQKSKKYSFVYKECSNRKELLDAINQLQPKSIIYNHHPQTLPWVNQDLKEEISIPQIGIIHEVTQELVDVIKQDLFDYYIAPDPTLSPNNPIVFKTGRLVPKYVNAYPVPPVITIGSFGFATAGKGFEKLIIAVQDEFDEAIIRLHIPVGDFASLDSEDLINRCKQLVVKPKINLIISHDFLNTNQLLSFLAQNTVNVFLYEEHKNRGVSSVIDYALAVDRPIAITDSNMFRHITSDKSFMEDNMTIFIANRSEDEYSNLSKFNKIKVRIYIILKRLFYSKKFGSSGFKGIRKANEKDRLII